MTKSDQHRLIEELRDCVRKMNREEQETFAMFVKRDREDEDLDSLSRQTLERLHAKYVVKKTKKDIEELLRKFSARQKKDGQTE